MSTNPRSLGKYELQERLGRGGMAEVWKAFDPQLKRYVAIKFLHANLQADPTFAARFIREAQAVASLRHPNIIRIYDFETSTSASDDSMFYMIMDYIEGQTLADYIRTTSFLHKFPTAAETVHLFAPIGAAIEYAHQHGMVHRDIKPANILLDKYNTARNVMGEPVLSDFGIVKMLGTATGTLTSSSVGTPLYISPEQAKGQPGNEASDIYSLGVTLYEFCTGVPPFHGDSPFAILNQHITTPPPSPTSVNPALSPALEAVILRCLAKEPAERFPSAAAFTSALAETLEQPTTTTDMMGSPTYYKPFQGDATLRVTGTSPAQGENSNSTAFSEETLPTLVTTPRSSTPSIYPPAQVPSADPSSSSAQSPAQVDTPVVTGSASDVGAPLAGALSHTDTRQDAQSPSALETSMPERLKPGARRTGLYVALTALLIILLGGSGLAAFIISSGRNRTQPQPSTTAAALAGHGFFSNSGQSSGGNNLGINDIFQVRLTNISNPAQGNSYYAWLLPDNNASEAPSLGLGPLNIANGTASLSTTYVDPQHNNLIGSFSRLLITEEATNPPPQSFSLDKKMWRYYAEIPQTPASTNCVNSLNQLSVLCHVRHLLSRDPEVQRVGLPSGLNYWFLNNIEEVQKWAREATDSNSGPHIRHKIVNILFMLDGAQCLAQDLQHASTAPGVANTPDDNTLNRIAGISLLDCALTPALPSYLLHIHNHLSAIVQAPGVLSDQVTLAVQVSSELNTIKALLTKIHTDAQQLIAMDDTQLTQTNAQRLRSEIDALSTRILSGGNDPTTGEPQPGIAHISDQMQQLATFDIKPYTTT